MATVPSFSPYEGALEGRDKLRRRSSLPLPLPLQLSRTTKLPTIPPSPMCVDEPDQTDTAPKRKFNSDTQTIPYTGLPSPVSPTFGETQHGTSTLSSTSSSSTLDDCFADMFYRRYYSSTGRRTRRRSSATTHVEIASCMSSETDSYACLEELVMLKEAYLASPSSSPFPNLTAPADRDELALPQRGHGSGRHPALSVADLMAIVFEYLPAETLLVVARVCRVWRGFLSEDNHPVWRRAFTRSWPQAAPLTENRTPSTRLFGESYRHLCLYKATQERRYWNGISSQQDAVVFSSSTSQPVSSSSTLHNDPRQILAVSGSNVAWTDVWYSKRICLGQLADGTANTSESATWSEQILPENFSRVAVTDHFVVASTESGWHVFSTDPRYSGWRVVLRCYAEWDDMPEGVAAATPNSSSSSSPSYYRVDPSNMYLPGVDPDRTCVWWLYRDVLVATVGSRLNYMERSKVIVWDLGALVPLMSQDPAATSPQKTFPRVKDVPCVVINTPFAPHLVHHAVHRYSPSSAATTTSPTGTIRVLAASCSPHDDAEGLFVVYDIDILPPNPITPSTMYVKRQMGARSSIRNLYWGSVHDDGMVLFVDEEGRVEMRWEKEELEDGFCGAGGCKEGLVKATRVDGGVERKYFDAVRILQVEEMKDPIHEVYATKHALVVLQYGPAPHWLPADNRQGAKIRILDIYTGSIVASSSPSSPTSSESDAKTSASEDVNAKADLGGIPASVQCSGCFMGDVEVDGGAKEGAVKGKAREGLMYLDPAGGTWRFRPFCKGE
ncbi:hypothetical protein HK102_000797 [Quaeritorhiza haematococci]|nr:hypothetical protein HK102_000797 [Quaeritorhiza haematococci]